MRQVMYANFSTATREGLKRWATELWGDENILEFGAPWPMAWGWILVLLKESQDRPEWFPKGKWATLQILERWLTDAAREELEGKKYGHVASDPGGSRSDQGGVMERRTSTANQYGPRDRFANGSPEGDETVCTSCG